MRFPAHRAVAIPTVLRSLAAASLAALFTLAASAISATAQAATSGCVPAGEWVIPASGGGKRTAATDVLANAAKSSVVLLGESHDDMDHHRWQLQMLAALSPSRGSLVLGFESFPRRVQGALDRWVAGDLSEADFLVQSDWRKVWNMDAQLYLPLFHFARMNRVPMLALNVESDLVRSIARNGLQSVPDDKREGVGKAAPRISIACSRPMPLILTRQTRRASPAAAIPSSCALSMPSSSGTVPWRRALPMH